MESDQATCDVTLPISVRGLTLLTGAVNSSLYGTAGYFNSQSSIKLITSQNGKRVRWIVMGH